MSEEKRQKEKEIPMIGVFLVFAGTVLLLQNFSYLPWELWEKLWQFWPVLLITAGLGILLRRFNPWLVSVLMLAILFGCLGIAYLQYQGPLPSGSPI